MRIRPEKLANEGETMAVPQTPRDFWLQPATQRQADALVLKLFCPGSFMLLFLIMARVL